MPVGITLSEVGRHLLWAAPFPGQGILDCMYKCGDRAEHSSCLDVSEMMDCDPDLGAE